MLHPYRIVLVVELVPACSDSPPRPKEGRHVVGWIAALIAAVLIIENWKVVIALVAFLAILSLIVSLVAVVVLVRKATRPVGQLTVLDVALATWAYRWWERRRARRQVGPNW